MSESRDELKATIKELLRELSLEEKTPKPPAPATKTTVEPLASIPRFESVTLQKPGGKETVTIARNQFGDYYWHLGDGKNGKFFKDRSHRLHWSSQLEAMLLTIQDMD